MALYGFFFVQQAVQDQSKHSVSYTLSRNKAIIVEYLRDEDTDMFQVGFVVDRKMRTLVCFK